MCVGRDQELYIQDNVCLYVLYKNIRAKKFVFQREKQELNYRNHFFEKAKDFMGQFTSFTQKIFFVNDKSYFNIVDAKSRKRLMKFNFGKPIEGKMDGWQRFVHSKDDAWRFNGQYLFFKERRVSNSIEKEKQAAYARNSIFKKYEVEIEKQKDYIDVKDVFYKKMPFEWCSVKINKKLVALLSKMQKITFERLNWDSKCHMEVYKISSALEKFIPVVDLLITNKKAKTSKLISLQSEFYSALKRDSHRQIIISIPKNFPFDSQFMIKIDKRMKTVSEIGFQKTKKKLFYYSLHDVYLIDFDTMSPKKLTINQNIVEIFESSMKKFLAKNPGQIKSPFEQNFYNQIVKPDLWDKCFQTKFSIDSVIYHFDQFCPVFQFTVVFEYSKKDNLGRNASSQVVEFFFKEPTEDIIEFELRMLAWYKKVKGLGNDTFFESQKKGDVYYAPKLIQYTVLNMNKEKTKQNKLVIFEKNYQKESEKKSFTSLQLINLNFHQSINPEFDHGLAPIKFINNIFLDSPGSSFGKDEKYRNSLLLFLGFSLVSVPLNVQRKTQNGKNEVLLLIRLLEKDITYEISLKQLGQSKGETKNLDIWVREIQDHVFEVKSFNKILTCQINKKKMHIQNISQTSTKDLIDSMMKNAGFKESQQTAPIMQCLCDESEYVQMTKKNIKYNIQNSLVKMYQIVSKQRPSQLWDDFGLDIEEFNQYLIYLRMGYPVFCCQHLPKWIKSL